ncbi:CST complex subunit STN1-like [Babylonia areolata]|uniref:CST complex subunit STN1-like n=1 Tax=Babylonia areolata TaxID=304850 RepID=UPI003FCF8716
MEGIGSGGCHVVMAEEGQPSADPVFYPPHLWGLDFHFNTFNKLYVADILSLKPYPSYPGAFAYKNHPVYKVDVMGVVVRKEDRPKLFLYSVDDGTGVVNCCCWKRGFSSQDMSEGCGDGCQLSPELWSELVALRTERESDTATFDLGDLLHVRGKLKQFRDLVEIVAYYTCRVDNPSHQVARMLELPHLYGQCYDKPFVPPYKLQQQLLPATKGKALSTQRFQLKQRIGERLASLRAPHFSLSDLMQDSALAHLAAHMGEGGQGEGAVREAVREMEEVEGSVCYRHHASPPFENLAVSSQLERHVMSTLHSLCSKPKQRERGCDQHQLLSQVHRSVQYSSLRPAALLFTLRRLEANSDVIRVTDRSYLPL